MSASEARMKERKIVALEAKGQRQRGRARGMNYGDARSVVETRRRVGWRRGPPLVKHCALGAQLAVSSLLRGGGRGWPSCCVRSRVQCCGGGDDGRSPREPQKPFAVFCRLRRPDGISAAVVLPCSFFLLLPPPLLLLLILGVSLSLSAAFALWCARTTRRRRARHFSFVFS